MVKLYKVYKQSACNVDTKLFSDYIGKILACTYIHVHMHTKHTLLCIQTISMYKSHVMMIATGSLKVLT